MSNDDKRGKLLSELRKGKNLTQRDLGDLIGYTDKNISYELCEEISCEVLDNFGVISNGIINGEFPLC